MPDALLGPILESLFVFRQRPVAVDPDLRPMRRVAILLILIDGCRGGAANLEQLHVLDWSVRTETSRLALLEFLTGERAPETAIVRFDPTLDRAVSLAVGADLLSVTALNTPGIASASLPDYRVELTDEGRQVVAALEANGDFEIERAFVRALPRKLTQIEVQDLFTWGHRP